MIKRVIASLFVFVLTFSPIPVFASVASPDTFVISSVEAYRDCIEETDQLYIITGTVEYGTNPTGYDVSDLVLIRLMDGTTELGSTSPYPFYDSGFDYFVVGLYFSAADVSENGMGWGESTGYSVRMEGNPFIDWTTGSPETTMSTFQLWYDGSSVSDTQSRVTTRLRVLARTAENNYDPTSFLFLESIGGELKLTAYGEDYFTNSIPNLRYIAPDLFTASSTPVNLEEKILTEDYYSTGDTTGAQAYGANWRAQTYTAKGTYEVVGVYLKLYKVGTPGSVTVSLRDAAANAPSGTDHVSGTIAGTEITSNTAGDWYLIIFNDGYTQTLNDEYSVVVRATTGDASNYVAWRVDETGNLTGGNRADSTDSGSSWAADTDEDFVYIMKGGIGTQTDAYAKQLEGNLRTSDLGVAIESLADEVGVGFGMMSGLVWYIGSFAAAALTVGVSKSFKTGLPIMAFLSPVGAYMGFIGLDVAIAVGVILGLGALYVAFHK